MNTAIRQWYIGILEKRHNLFEAVFYIFLLLLSFVYGVIVKIRNFLYNTGICKSFSVSAKIISVGNISWAGSGKTTLVSYLYRKLSNDKRIAILRRGYGEDEGKLFSELGMRAYAARDRVALAQALDKDYELFVLDDGFQYRALKRDLDIVVMGAREFRVRQRLIPASFFREPLVALRRADILLINYKEEIPDAHALRERIQKQFPHLKIFYSHYRIERLHDLENTTVLCADLKTKKLACCTAIGYPEGFLNKLKEVSLTISQTFVFPDHHVLTEDEVNRMQKILETEEITDVIITHKDKFHLPDQGMPVRVVICEIEIEIENEKDFLDTIKEKIALTH
jgi:tetraacyldisaccharide 4'-kinase